jgi:hypothetical protein
MLKKLYFDISPETIMIESWIHKHIGIEFVFNSTSGLITGLQITDKGLYKKFVNNHKKYWNKNMKKKNKNISNIKDLLIR